MYSPKVTQTNLKKLEETLGIKLRTYTIEECDALGLRIAGGETGPELDAYMLNELVRCPADFRYWLERYAFVHTDKGGKPRRVTIWPSQEILLGVIARKEEENPFQRVRVANLKARQQGLTTITQLIMAHRILFHAGTRGLSASNVEDKTFDLFLFLDRVYQNLPRWMQPEISDRVKSKHMVFPKMHSKINYAWSNQADPMGQGQTLDIVHLTEVSTWANPGYIKGDIEPAFNSSGSYLPLFICESTGAGAKGNYFCDMYEGGKKAQGGWVSVFISVFDSPNKYFDNPEGLTWADTTIQVGERWTRETGKILTPGQKAWYQKTRYDYESTGELETFFQEYPTCEEEAFQLGLKSVFPIAFRSKLRDQIKKPLSVYEVNPLTGLLAEVEEPEERKNHFNRLVIWDLPEKGEMFVVAVDASWGLGGENDNAAIEVLRVGTKERASEQVAEFYGDFSPIQLVPLCETLGELYRDPIEQMPAMLAIEAQPGSPGCITQEELIQRGYINLYRWERQGRMKGDSTTNILGWYTTSQSRPPLTQAGVDAIKGEALWVNSPQMLREMATYVAHPKKFGLTTLKYLGHADGYHDDCLMALFIAYYTAYEKQLGVVVTERLLKGKPTPGTVGAMNPLEYDTGMTFGDFYGDRGGYYGAR